MLPKGTPDWLPVARRNRLMLEAVARESGNHVTHRRAGTHRGKKAGWRQPPMEPFTPKGTR